ncbi:MAG TPA: EAL domain-containing protein [Gammaproteobacteria bacterium]|nr:EAL domain-containing protein [Gammaproteobacteria bacterium]
MQNENDLDINAPDFTQQQNKRLLVLEKDILEAIAVGKDPQNILDSLCEAAELCTTTFSASIMLLNSSQTALYVRSAPTLCEEAIQLLTGIVPGPTAASCGTAVYHGKPIYVEDTSSDFRWVDYQQYCKKFNVLSSWSQPIKTKDDLTIGSFALSNNIVLQPTSFQKRLLSVAANIAGIILQREKNENELWELAHKDIITGIPNRALLNQRLNHAIECAKRQKTNIALFFIDIDNFKKINDSHGHKMGDRVLIETASRISACIRTGDTLARYGGDEFVLLAENLTESCDVRLIAEKIISSLSKTMSINDKDLRITSSIGISVYPGDGSDAETLLKYADTAMYQAKKNGKNRFVCYESALTEAIQYRLKMEDELKQALEKNEFTLHYQPQYHTGNDAITSVEALIRWQHPKKGLLLPDEFIPIAEQSGLIREIGRWVIRQACQQGKKWLDRDINIEKIAVNMSAVQLSKGCYKTVQGILNETGFPASNLEVEITESLMIKKSNDTLAELNLMKNAGITISLDDFGTGYSSLSQLQQLPINKLKIDRSFVTDIPGNKNDEIIAKTIIAMGNSLGLNVIAEGVETREQADFLLRHGCNSFQGFLFSRPLTAHKLEEKIYR